MSRIDPKALDHVQAMSGIVIKSDAHGMPLAYKGPHLPDYFDNYTECLKENSAALRKSTLKAKGLNEHGQTPEQEKSFKQRQQVRLARKKKSEDALLAAEGISGGE